MSGLDEVYRESLHDWIDERPARLPALPRRRPSDVMDVQDFGYVEPDHDDEGDDLEAAA